MGKTQKSNKDVFHKAPQPFTGVGPLDRKDFIGSDGEGEYLDTRKVIQKISDEANIPPIVVKAVLVVYDSILESLGIIEKEKGKEMYKLSLKNGGGVQEKEDRDGKNE